MPRSLTRDQLEGRKGKAVRFVRDVLADPERADEIADEDLEDYAARRKIETLDNPTNRRYHMPRKTVEDYVCAFCGSARNVGVHHLDGDGANNEPANLAWACKCNGRIAAAMIRSGVGRRTRQYNPPATGAASLGEYVSALRILKGEISGRLRQGRPDDPQHAAGEAKRVRQGNLATATARRVGPGAGADADRRLTRRELDTRRGAVTGGMYVELGYALILGLPPLRLGPSIGIFDRLCGATFISEAPLIAWLRARGPAES